MELSRDNPNDALIPYYDGDKIRYIPVTEYYVLVFRSQLPLAKLALRETLKDIEGGPKINLNSKVVE